MKDAIVKQNLKLRPMSKKILLIDDDEDEQWVFTEALKEIDDSIECYFALTA